jgi:hypothetical protein
MTSDKPSQAMPPYLVAMQSRLDIFEYHRPDRWIRSNTEYAILAVSDDLEPYLVIGIGPKSRSDEAAAPDDLHAIHVMVGARIGGDGPMGTRTYLLNRHLPDDLEMPAFFRSGQFFPADGMAEVSFSDGMPGLSVLGRHAHARGDDDRALEVTERGMRCRKHIDGRVDDVRFALTWKFTAARLPWALEMATMA